MSFIHILNKIPQKVCIALSGGLDSMVCLDFLIKGNKDILALHFNHGTKDSDIYQNFVEKQCKKLNIPLKIKKISKDIPKGRSKEDFWREQRYIFFDEEREFRKVITCHHLDDVVETWIFSSIKSNSKLIPYSREYIIRPFILNKKNILKEWAIKNNVKFIEDKTNYDIVFARNYIRHNMIKDVLYINPGIHKMLKKKIVKKWRNVNV